MLTEKIGLAGKAALAAGAGCGPGGRSAWRGPTYCGGQRLPADL